MKSYNLKTDIIMTLITVVLAVLTLVGGFVNNIWLKNIAGVALIIVLAFRILKQYRHLNELKNKGE